MVKSRDEYWTKDIEQIAKELPQRHKNLFFNTRRSVFEKQIKHLTSSISKYDDLAIILNIASIIASIGDAHTCLMLPVNRYLPVQFYCFDEGIYIIGATLEYKHLIGYRVLYFDNIPIMDTVDRVSKIISHENQSFLKAQLPRYLCAMEVLFGLGISDQRGFISITLEKGVELLNVNLPAFSLEEINDKGGLQKETCENGEMQKDICSKGEGQSNNKRQETNIESPLYRRNQGTFYWKQYIEESHTLYVNYNSCRNMEDITVSQFCEDLKHFIENAEVKRLVVDIRNNLGGDSTLLEPFIRWLRNCEKLNRNGGIFVILGRDTFSSALLNAFSFKNKTKAIFIGEPSGGKPNCYGEVEYFSLSNSKLKIRYSTQYYKIVKDDRMLAFYPDVDIKVTAIDYFSNIDACVTFLHNYRLA